mgnify:FL=1
MKPTAEPTLELFHAAPSGPSRPVDLIFVHGISAGAWLWQDGALDFFSAKGYRSWSLSLSGHGGSTSDKPLAHLRLEDYAQDLATALDEIDRPTVVIAHSLCGAVAQKLMSRGHRTAGMALVCSVPPYGLMRASVEMAIKKPHLWREMAVYCLHGLAAADMEVIRSGLFPTGIEDDVFNRLAGKLQDESFLAMSEASVSWPPFAAPPGPRPDLLVIGGAEDCFVPPLDTFITAWWYGTQAHVIPKAGHMLMYEPAGQIAAQTILKWLERLTEAPAGRVSQ